MSPRSGPPQLDPQVERGLAVGLFHRTWELLDLASRTPGQDDEMVDAAHASAWHWRQVGTRANEARAHWLCSRVYATLGRPEAAVLHARRAVEIVTAGGPGFDDWDAAAASEGMARALIAAGDRAAASEWKERALAALDAIADVHDREPIEADIASLLL